MEDQWLSFRPYTQSTQSQGWLSIMMSHHLSITSNNLFKPNLSEKNEHVNNHQYDKNCLSMILDPGPSIEPWDHMQQYKFQQSNKNNVMWKFSILKVSLIYTAWQHSKAIPENQAHRDGFMISLHWIMMTGLFCEKKRRYLANHITYDLFHIYYV